MNYLMLNLHVAGVLVPLPKNNDFTPQKYSVTLALFSVLVELFFSF